MRATIAVAMLVASAVPAAAQKTAFRPTSCAAADADIGPATKQEEVRKDYDAMTDSTRLATKQDNRMAASFVVRLSYLGKHPAGAPNAVFEYSEHWAANGVEQNLGVNNGKYSKDTPFLLLIDDSVRMGLSGAAYTAAPSAAFGPVPSTLDETLAYSLTLDQLATLGRARKIRIRIREIETDLAGKVVKGTRELYRFALCTQSSGEAASQ